VPYTGPVADLSEQFILDSSMISDWINVTAGGDQGVFIHTGNGDDGINISAVTAARNVMDGGLGSNFLTGGAGADTFFVDDRNPGAAIWSTVTNLAHGDDATVWGITPDAFNITWVDDGGAAGYTGLTMHAASDGRPDASMTFSGFTSTDLSNGRLTVSFGSVDGNQYMHVTANV
jgi:serralysin